MCIRDRKATGAKKETAKKHQIKSKYKTSQVTVDYFPRGGSAALPDKKSKKLIASEDSEFVFNKAPVTLVKKKRKAPYEMEVPEMSERKRKKAVGEELEDTPMLEAATAKKAEGLDVTRIRRLVNCVC
eukprot:TRINITY_DN12049_c0_g1_i1.p1 TRINITY_DN12049_c0_g1~~TRINITY_DN12049_c0_g1_i1.p1  ORF type:complete len:128 (+),score=51.24 TRINITY_DN12049_c0_g1_i1:71-454(+)